jgi:hypothetical protein
MRVVESTLAHFPRRRFGLIESIVDERVIAPNVNERVLFCANKKKRGQQTRSKQISRVRANRPKKRRRTHTSASSGRTPRMTLTYTMFGSVQKGRSPAASRDSHHLAK